MSKTKDLLRDHMAVLQAKRDGIVAKSAPLRAEYDKIVNDSRQRAKAVSDKVKEIEAELYDTDKEIAALAKATGGRAMSDVP